MAGFVPSQQKSHLFNLGFENGEKLKSDMVNDVAHSSLS